MRYSKLRGRIREKYGTQAAFSTAMNAHPATISNKLTGKSDWNRAEIELACRLLGISAETVHEYFFSA